MQKKKSIRGHTAAEIIIALGVLTLLGLVIAQVYQGVLANSQQKRLASTRDQIVLLIRQSASNLQSLRNSLNQPENIQFFNCVCGQGAGCRSAQEYPFRLYDLQSTPPTPVPMYYDASGSPCDRTAKNCLIMVETKFIAQCLPHLPDSDPTPPENCMGESVEFFGVLYKVQQNPLAENHGAPLKAINGTAFTQVAHLKSSGPGVCP